MVFTATKKILKKGQKFGYAVPAFNIYNLETMQAAAEAAGGLGSPLILATTPGTVSYAGAKHLVSIAQTTAEEYEISLCLHLDHAEDVDFIKECIDFGYRSVMIDASQCSFEENIKRTKEIVEYGKDKGVSVEAELGRIGGTEDGIEVSKKDAFLTDPKAAQEFVKRTEIDSLAVAIGTAHGEYDQEPELDFDRLEEIEKKVDIPLVLHGASGVPEKSVKQAVGLGICKVNIATELKVAFAQGVKGYLSENSGAIDLRSYLTPGKKAMREVAAQKINLCGSKGQIKS